MPSRPHRIAFVALAVAACDGPGNSGRAPLEAITAETRAFSRRDQLQQLLRIVQPLFELGTKRLRGDLCRHADFTRGRIGCHELHFIDLDG